MRNSKARRNLDALEDRMREERIVTPQMLDFPMLFVFSLLAEGMEHSRYWCNTNGNALDLAEVLLDGKTMIMEDKEEAGQHYAVTLQSVKMGIDLFSHYLPSRHYDNWMRENWDAETGEVFFQLVVMGKVLYS